MTRGAGYRIPNSTRVDQWMWIARYQLRKGQPARACEAMLLAIWLMGVTP